MDWKVIQAQRDAAGKRDVLARLNAQLANTELLLTEARAFEGYYSARLAELDRQLGPLCTSYAPDGYAVRRATPEQERQAEAVRARIREVEQERDQERAQRTHGGVCELSVDHMVKRRRRLTIARDEVQRELAEIESSLTPGELVQSGVPAAEYLEHRQRVEALRARIGGAA